MSSVRAEGLSFSYSDAVTVLSDVTVHIPPGLTGVVGENGAGKSTLLSLVAGELQPTGGRLRLDPPSALAIHCRQGTDHPGAEVLWLAREGDAAARRLASRLALDPESLHRWDTLSPGERRRWQIAAALAREPDVLLLDEPTNHVDAEARAIIVEALRRYRGVGLVVSHDRELLDALTSRTLRLHRGGARLYAGAYGAARGLWEAEAKAGWDARAAAQEASRRLARQLAAARGDLAQADAKRRAGNRMKGRHDHDARSMSATTLAAWAEDRLGRKVEVLRRATERATQEIPDALPEHDLGRSVFVGFAPAPRPWLLALDAERVDAGGVPVLQNVKVRLGRGDRVHLQGPNGAGKTTLLRSLIRGADLPEGRLLYVPQELEELEGAALLESVRTLAPEVRGRVLSVVAALGSPPERLLRSGRPSPGETGRR